jgi:hypothetical protein
MNDGTSPTVTAAQADDAPSDSDDMSSSANGDLRRRPRSDRNLRDPVATPRRPPWHRRPNRERYLAPNSMHFRVDGSVAQLLVEGGVVKLGQFVERGPRGRQMFPLGNIRQPLIAGDLHQLVVSDYAAALTSVGMTFGWIEATGGGSIGTCSTGRDTIGRGSLYLAVARVESRLRAISCLSRLPGLRSLLWC